MDLLKILSKVTIFQGLRQDELVEVAALCREVEFEEGTPVFHESDTGRELYILLEGQVSIEMEMPLGSKGWEKLATIREGDVFGEMCFVCGLRRSAIARAEDRTRALVIESEALNRLLDQNHHMGYVVMRRLAEVLCRRLENTDFMWRNAVMAQRASVVKGRLNVEEK